MLVFFFTKSSDNVTMKMVKNMKLNSGKRYVFRRERYVLIGLLACMFLCSVGYAILSQQLKINGVSTITTNFDIYIESITESSVSNAETVGNPSVINKTSGKIEVNLNAKGSKAIYDVTVRNAGNVDALITAIEGIEEANQSEPIDVRVSTSGLQTYAPLLQGKTITFQIIVEWDGSITTSSNATNKTIAFTVEYQQKMTDSPTPEPTAEPYPKDLRIRLVSKGELLVPTGQTLVTTNPSGSTSSMIIGNLDSGVFEVGHSYQVKVETHVGLFYSLMGGPLAIQIKPGEGFDSFETVSGSWVVDGNISTFDFTISAGSSLANNIGGFTLGEGGSYFSWNTTSSETLTIATISVYQTA